MPASYKIFPDWRLKYVHVSSSIELEELLPLAERYFEDPEFDLSIRFMVDLTDLVSSSARFRDVFTLYSFYRRKLPQMIKPIDVAIVAPKDFAFGMSHMFLALANLDSVMRLKIFEDKSNAATWLDVPVHIAEGFRTDEQLPASSRGMLQDLDSCR
jgi:hypothetical protein